jgi:hypothetical protein
VQADEIIRDLIATGTMNDDTLADLERMRKEIEGGTLHPDDAAYLQALHAKVNNAPMPDPIEDNSSARLDGLSIGEWRDRALRAETELAALRDQLTSGATN